MKILVTEPMHEAGIELLRGEFEVEVRLGLSPAALVREVGGYDAIITRSGTAVTAEMMEAGGERLKVVGRAGIGVDNIDISAATERGVAVVNAPNGNVRAAAEHTIGLMFALARNIPRADHLLREGVWGKNHFMGTEIAGKTLGIIGLGKVGSQVARRALALDMEVIAYDPFVEQGPDVPLVGLDDLLRRADFVSLHVPLTALTANMIGARELELMKESAYLVNCARGRVVDEGALYEACKHGRIGGAALDVFSDEPLTASPLLELDNVVLTPHLGGTTHEATRASALEVAAQVRALLVGEYPTHVVNPEVLEDSRGLAPVPPAQERRVDWGTPPNPRQGDQAPQAPWNREGEELGDTPKPPAGRPPHPLMGQGEDWGTPPDPRQGDPRTPFGDKERVGGAPPNAQQRDPCTPFVGEEEELGNTPKRPAGRPLHPRSSDPGCPLDGWERFERVVFDCDSTLSEIEGIDELAAMNGALYEVAEMTRRAMGGAIAFEEVFGRRLELIRPTRKQLDGVGKLYVASLVEDAVASTGALAHLGIEVRLVSGGYKVALVPLAAKLGIAPERLHANELRFDEGGEYVGFDGENPLCRSGGKAEVVRSLAPRSTMFVGDGASDVEVGRYVELFVGYGGIAKRKQVHEAAPVYLHGESLAPVVVMAAGLEGCRELLGDARFRPLVIKGFSILMREGAADYRPECRPFFTRLRKFCLEGICS